MISQDYTEYYRLCAFRMDEPMAVSFLQSRGILPETVKQTKKLLPGYLFLASDDPQKLSEQCKKNHMLAKNDELILLSEQDMRLFSLAKDGILEISKGIIVDQKLTILSGPLKGRESQIKKIDRHKRRAWVSVELFGKEQLIEVGLEVFQKIETTKS